MDIVVENIIPTMRQEPKVLHEIYDTNTHKNNVLVFENIRVIHLFWRNFCCPNICYAICIYFSKLVSNTISISNDVRIV